jgi:protein-L-isoaspartate(D-aspartate) O-methyltransferase
VQLRHWSWRSLTTAAAALAAGGLLYAAAQDYAAARAAMVSNLREQGVKNTRVLAAMGRVSRHVFVSDSYRGRAYDDVEVPANFYGEVVASPYIIAFVLETLDPKPSGKVLEVGTGAGYETALLAEMGTRVYTVERSKPVADEARRAVQSLGYRTVRFGVGDCTQGWRAYAPYDCIVVTTPVDRVPPPLFAQLEDGGCLVVPVGRGPEQTLNRIRKNGGRIEAEVITIPRGSRLYKLRRR